MIWKDPRLLLLHMQPIDRQASSKASDTRGRPARQHNADRLPHIPIVPWLGLSPITVCLTNYLTDTCPLYVYAVSLCQQ